MPMPGSWLVQRMNQLKSSMDGVRRLHVT